MKSDPPLALFKFGRHCHIDSFVHGQLYMNPLSYFAKLEDDELRADSHEGQELWLQADRSPVYVTINGVPTLIPGIHGGIGLTSNRNLDANAFCMYVLRSSRAKQEHLIDPRNLRFGDTFALFRLEYVEEFIRRVRVAAETRELTLRWDLVEYVDPATHHGEMGVFRKVKFFEYQSEFRFVIVAGIGAPYKLSWETCRTSSLRVPWRRQTS